MKKVLFTLLLIGITVISCTKEEAAVNLAAPIVSAPSATTEVQAEQSVEVTFSVTAAAGYVSASATANGGYATIISQPTAGSTSGNIVVSFVAGTNAGAGSIILNVVDAESDKSDATAVVNITASPVVATDAYLGNGGILYIDSTNNHWTNDLIWHISGKIVVESGVTLTVDAGTIVKASTEANDKATAIVVSKGGKLNAVGTAASPIVFTSESDNVTYESAHLVGSNLDYQTKNLWGGIILLGKANAGVVGGLGNIEGIPVQSYTEYGSTTPNDADNSGDLEYLSIRHSGVALSEGNELQGLTLGGVGSGTTIKNIEVVASGDDGIEIFGGAPVLENILIWAQNDDGLDFDQAFKGSVSNALIVLDVDSDNGLEIDGTEDSTLTIDGAYTISNITIVGALNPLSGKNHYADWKADATGHNKNIVFRNFASGSYIKGIDPDTYAGAATEASLRKLTFENIEFVTSDSLADIFGVKTAVTDYDTWATKVATQTTGSGADETVFGWTWYANK